MEWQEHEEIVLQLPWHEDIQNLRQQLPKAIAAHLQELLQSKAHLGAAIFAENGTGKLLVWRLAELYTRAVNILLVDLHNAHLRHRAMQQLLEVSPPLARHLIKALLTEREAKPRDLALCATLADIIGDRGEKVAQDGLIDTFIWVLKSGEVHLWQDLLRCVIEATGKLALPRALYYLTGAAVRGDLPKSLLPTMAKAIDSIARSLSLETYDLEELKIKVQQSPGTIIRGGGWWFAQLQAVDTLGWREFEEKYFPTWDGHVWNDYRRYIRW